jgi:hypothetical protein
MFVPCPRLVLERTSSASVLGVKRASGPDLPCAADFVYTPTTPFAGEWFFARMKTSSEWKGVVIMQHIGNIANGFANAFAKHLFKRRGAN